MWDWFTEWFWSQYISNGYSIIPLTYSEIGEWVRLVQIEIEPFEVKLLVKLDLTYRNYIAERNKSGKVINQVDATDGAGVASFMRGLKS